VKGFERQHFIHRYLEKEVFDGISDDLEEWKLHVD
jgi:hypothetical protein